MILSTLDQVTQQATRAGEVIKRIRSFVRKEEPVRLAADINLVIKETLSFLEDDTTRQNIKIDIDLQPELPTVTIDHIQVEQVILNLFRNSLEAMSKSTSSENKLSIKTKVSGNDIVITVIDNGPGLPAAKDSIFDPFVTSKVNGLGLGLSISRSIVEAHNGRLLAEQNQDQGATFVIELPV